MSDATPADTAVEDGAGPAPARPRVAHTTVAGRAMGVVGWLAVLSGLAIVGVSARLVGRPPFWVASGPLVWVPIVFAIAAALRDRRSLPAWSLSASALTAAVGIADLIGQRRVLGRYELLLAASGLAVTVAVRSGRIRPAGRRTAAGR